MRTPTLALALVAAVAAVPAAPAADRYVSTNGSNAGAGSLASPWRSIDFAADRASPGDTIWVRGGEYRERLTPSRSGTAGSRITIRNFPDETPIIDGTDESVGGQTALVDLGDRSHLTLRGFHIRNLTTSNNSHTPLGILVDGACAGIHIVGCEIYAIENNGSDGNAHGILCQGTRTTPISDLVIRGNEIRDLVLGNSEALVLNGNVDGFEVRDNYVHDCNNLGIDFIGFEGNGPDGLDQARNGICAGNTVTNISTINNPAYNAYTAGGIYVDGGRDIIIERNFVSYCDIGIEVASEAPGRATSDVLVRNNLIWHNRMGGVFVGGYNESRGAATDVFVTGNTLFENDTLRRYSGEILVQFNTTRLAITNNILFPNSQKDFIVIGDGNNSAITLDYNLYFCSAATSPAASEWIWNGDFLGSFSQWRSTTGQDSNSIYLNPRFADPAAADLRITPTSPARDSGDPSYVGGEGETGAFGNPRVAGGRVDIGAHELAAAALTELEQWRLDHFGTTDNLGDAADLADPDADGKPNLIEFGLAGQDPTAPTPGACLDAVGEGEPAFAFTPNPPALLELDFRIASSTDLAEWTLIAARPAAGAWQADPRVTLSESGGQVGFFDLRPGLGEQRFYRIEITLPQP